LGNEGAEMEVEEADGRFFLTCYRSSSERQLVLSLGSKTTSETWVLDADTPTGEFRCLAPHQEDHEYVDDHSLLTGQWTWFLRSNQAGINFALYAASEAQPSREHWRELIGHDNARMLEGVSLNQDAFVLSLREGGLPIIEVHPQGGAPYPVQLPDAAY